MMSKKIWIVLGAILLALLGTNGMAHAGVAIGNAVVLDPYDPVPPVQFRHWYAGCESECGQCGHSCIRHVDCADGCARDRCDHNCYRDTCDHDCYRGTCGHDCYRHVDCRDDCNRGACDHGCYRSACDHDCCDHDCYRHTDCHDDCDRGDCDHDCYRSTCNHDCDREACEHDCGRENCDRNDCAPKQQAALPCLTGDCDETVHWEHSWRDGTHVKDEYLDRGRHEGEERYDDYDDDHHHHDKRGRDRDDDR